MPATQPYGNAQSPQWRPNEWRPNGYGRYRSVFVSDVHLGCRFARPAKFLRFLNEAPPCHLYLVGDIIDGWRLRRRWRWVSDYGHILNRLLELAALGTQIHYTPGNHDEFARDLANRFGPVRIADEFIHATADGRQFVVLHGDRFDRIERRARWISFAGCMAQDLWNGVNDAMYPQRRRLRAADWSLSTPVNRLVSQGSKRIAGIEKRLADHARAREVSGVICGHTHAPCVRRINDVLYCNTGDWVENHTALVEHHNGSLELLHDLGAGALAERGKVGRRFQHNRFAKHPQATKESWPDFELGPITS